MNKKSTDLKLETVIVECLPLLKNGGESAESVLARYPEFRSALQRPLEAACWLWERSRLFDPRPGFVKSSKKHLIEQISKKTPIIA
jgi:hypothetical protein